MTLTVTTDHGEEFTIDTENRTVGFLGKEYHYESVRYEMGEKCSSVLTAFDNRGVPTFIRRISKGVIVGISE